MGLPLFGLSARTFPSSVATTIELPKDTGLSETVPPTADCQRREEKDNEDSRRKINNKIRALELFIISAFEQTVVLAGFDFSKSVLSTFSINSYAHAYT